MIELYEVNEPMNGCDYSAIEHDRYDLEQALAEAEHMKDVLENR